MELISEGIRGGGRGWLCEVFFPGASYYSSVVAHPLIISVKRPLQGKIEFIRQCTNVNKRLSSHFTFETITFRITAWCNSFFDGNIISRGFPTNMENHGYSRGKASMTSTPWN